MAVTAVAAGDQFQQAFEAFVSGRDEPAALAESRRAAFARFQRLGLPHGRLEAWRFTDTSALREQRFTPALEVPVDAARLPPALAEGGPRLVFVNGRYHAALSAPGTLPAGLSVRPLAEEPPAPLPGLDNHPFTALNEAFWEEGVLIRVARGVRLTQPLALVFVNTGEDTVRYPRLRLELASGAEAVVVEEHRGDGRYLSCPLAEVVIGAGAGLDYHRVQDESVDAWHLAGLRLTLGRDARVTVNSVSLGGRLARADLHVCLDGEGADCTLNGLTVVSGSQLGDHHLRVEHVKPHGGSRQMFKGILQDKGQVVFDGMIYVAPGAQKTDASQQSRNLLLSRQAKAHANPRLEIYADDVKCAHGSAVGFLDPDALFYLRTRGLDALEARRLLVRGFADDSLERIRLASLCQRLEEQLAQRLKNA